MSVVLDPAERSRLSSRDAKRRRRGVCRECGGETRYAGKKGQPVSTLCTACDHRLRHEARIWTRETVIAAIQAWAAEHGKPPSSHDWLHVDPERRWPNRGNVYQGREPLFPSWADAIAAAGFPRPRPPYHGRKGELVWTKERTLEALRQWAAEHGRPPGINDWRRAAEGRPTAVWVQHLFGRWNVALKLAGLPIRLPGQKVAA